MTRRARLTWLVAIFIVQLIYFPINRTVQGGVILATPWDTYIPFWPIWAIPYLLSLCWWTASFVWAAWKMDTVHYRAFAISMIAVMLTSYVFYILYPTYVQRPELKGDNWQTALIRFIYANDRLNNAFPSGHTYITMLIVFFWWNWRPQLRWLWVAMAIIVILSTLFTGQHNLPDPIGGIVWAWAGYRFGLWWTTRQLGIGEKDDNANR
jgi:membrane-associated phospholipid phosphatase